MAYYVGLDIGGSHVYAALFKDGRDKHEMVCNHRSDIDSSAGTVHIINQFSELIVKVSAGVSPRQINGIGFSIPGPFNYQSGICQIQGVGKYEGLFGLNLRFAIAEALHDFDLDPGQITFINDAEAFLLGAAENEGLRGHNITAFTLGTGFGSASIWDGKLLPGFPGKGYLYNDPYQDSTAEEYFSAKWFLREFSIGDGVVNYNVKGVKELASMAVYDQKIRNLFQQFGENLADYSNRLFTGQQPCFLIIGGNIAKSHPLIAPSFNLHLKHTPGIKWMDNTSELAARGAVAHHRSIEQEYKANTLKRKSASPVLPALKTVQTNGYDIYPAFSLKDGTINRGFDSLAEFISEQKALTIILDGNIGTDWDSVIADLSSALHHRNSGYLYVDVNSALLSEEQIDKQVEDYLGGNDPIFGRLYEGDLADFFDKNKLEMLKRSSEKRTILYGTGASLAGVDSPVIYIDIPKNEIQYRSRAGSICNIGKQLPEDPKTMYKRFYYIDWVVCNRHKQQILPELCAIADGQRDGDISWITGNDLRHGLEKMACSPFRVRPWFEPGVWGGKWMQEHFSGLNPDADNFAWSFELIAPENGIIFESEGKMLEIGFEWLMFHSSQSILGEDSGIYGTYFPLRFDYLDTMEGGNLSLQCHPQTEYIQDHFGEMITQDETYYILEAKPGARVYLGFREDIDPAEFESDLYRSHGNDTALDADHYVQSFPASKHDLFLIPAGTIHCSGKDNVVLEISNTPYIYTFKMYDWQRMDLDGKPRPINIDRAMENLDFSRAGRKVSGELISKPKVISDGPNGRVIDLPTHEKHLYRVQRLEIANSLKVSMNGKFQVINLVEGSVVKILAAGRTTELRYAETMIIPAATGEYEIINESESKAGIVKAFMK
jgi:predicted NBD/HSP70 family sugar kinase/mannose-6-phosphate isomerase class I